MMKQFKAFVLLIHITLAIIVVGCQKTPDNPIVAHKSAANWSGAVIPASEALPYSAPERYQNEIIVDDLTIQLNAEVYVPDLTAYPVYLLEKTRFTQEDADNFMSVLLKGAELYNGVNIRTKQVVQNAIDYYRTWLEVEVESGNESNIVEAYQGFISDLSVELSKVPDLFSLSPSSRVLEFKKIEALKTSYGGFVVTGKDTGQDIWTAEGIVKARDDGNEAIDGIAQLPDGRFMELLIANMSLEYMETQVSFGLAPDYPREYKLLEHSMDDARNSAKELLNNLGLDFVLVAESQHEDWSYLPATVEFNSNNNPYEEYSFIFSRNIPGTYTEPIQAVRYYSDPTSAFTPPLLKETLTMDFNGFGLCGLTYRNPVRIKSIEHESVSLIPWQEIMPQIETMLKAKTFWQSEYDAGDEYIIGRRLEISRIALNYMQVRKDSDSNETYYIPVWDCMGALYYKYSEDYPSGTSSDYYTLDENFEHLAFGVSIMPESLLTINAIDGTVIDRERGY